MTQHDFVTKPPYTVLAPIPGYGRVFDSSFSPESGHDKVVGNWPLLPWPRGPLSALVVSALQRQPGTLGATPPLSRVDPLADDDFGLALYLCYEMHRRGLASADWEWDPGLVKFRTDLEEVFVERLRDEVGAMSMKHPGEAVSAINEVIDDSSRSPLTLYFNDSGTIDQFREFCVHRSAHQVRPTNLDVDAEPLRSVGAMANTDTFVPGEFVSDAEMVRSVFFSDVMTSLGLDASYGSYVEILPGVTFATVNLASLFSFHPRWRAALLGYTAVSNTTSMESMERYSRALRRYGLRPVGRRFTDVAVDVDTRRLFTSHDRVTPAILGTQPQMAGEALFGATALLLLEQRFADHLLDAWTANRSSLVPWELYPR